MKINWGTGIAIAIVFFIAFILYFVVTMTTNNKYSHDLVTEKYYQQELNYQQEIEALKNADDFKEKITFSKSEEGLNIKIPNTLSTEQFKVFLYRPSNKQLDFEVSFSNTNSYLLVPDKRLVDGRWNMKMLWNSKNKNYLIKKEFIY